MTHRIRLIGGAFLFALLIAVGTSVVGACSDDDNGSGVDAGTDASDAQTFVDASPGDGSAGDAGEPIVVTSQSRSYPVPLSEPNPVTGQQAPPETATISVTRFWARNGTRPTKAIVLAYPGAALGAGSYAELAKNLIVRSKGAIELWAYERRSNVLEDRVGIDAAKRGGDVNIATGYYADGQVVDGHVFGGVIGPTEPTYMSEWGLAQEVRDLSMVLHFIDEEKRKTNVILLGFSLGAPIVSDFAAWDFDGQKGSDDLAGIVMLDGGGLRQSLTENEYHHEGCVGSLGLSVGLDDLRAHGPYYQQPGLDAGFWLALEIAGMRASGLYGDPSVEIQDQFIKDMVSISEDKADLRFTARAALGLMVDDQFSPALVMRTSVGTAVGGDLEKYHNPFSGEDLMRPADTNVVYSWQEYDQTDPPELTSLDDVADAISAGPTGGLEWYPPVRLTLDQCAVDSLDVAASDEDYRWKLGFRVTHNAEMDAPVFFFFAEYGEIFDMQFVENYRLSLPPVGPDRPNTGVARDPSLPAYESGFALIVAPKFHHLDTILAASETGETYLYGPLVDFILANTQGTVSGELP